MTGVIGWRALGNGPASVTWSATDGELDTTAEMTSRAWGTAIQLRMTDLDPGEHCKLVVHSTDGFTETTGWWATTGVHEAQVPASTSIPLADISRIEVVTATGRVLSTLTPSSR
jgi:hypothetical protein